MNLPNKLTVCRLAMPLVVMPCLLKDFPYSKTLALAFFALASVTDFLDGHIARKHNLVTDFGKLMDPLADKLMVISMMASLAIKGIAPWAALAIIVVKELTMVTGGLILLKHNVVVYARWIGKIAQATVVCALISCFFHEWLLKTS